MSTPNEYAILGGLSIDYIITHEGVAHNGILGGNAVYAAVGVRIWGGQARLVARRPPGFPVEWIQRLERSGISMTHLRRTQQLGQLRRFLAYPQPDQRFTGNAAAHYLRIESPLPKALIGDGPEAPSVEALGPLSLRPDDLPDALSDFPGAHVCSGESLSHSVLPGRLRELGVGVVTLDPGSDYMQPPFGGQLGSVVHSLDAFLPSERQAIEFFRRSSMNVWDMAAGFADMGCRIVVLKRGRHGQCAYDASSGQRWQIPAYPAKVQDVTGAGHAYCGGFLTGLCETGDVLEAALRGSVSASLVIEGTGATYALEALPGLAEARLASLRPLAKRV